MQSFTHVDPFEDTERARLQIDRRARADRFTHVDPFEDTERKLRVHEAQGGGRFTHVDPFEDTERTYYCIYACRDHNVSPTSIRSRILRAMNKKRPSRGHLPVSPTSIRSRILKGPIQARARP